MLATGQGRFKSYLSYQVVEMNENSNGVDKDVLSAKLLCRGALPLLKVRVALVKNLNGF